jgi:[histone H3]-trimethyl-L-lysine4 demethylase
MHAATPRGSPSRRGRSPKSRTDSPSPIQQAGTASSQAIKTSATFISSLSIPVEGAVRIEPDNSEGSTPSRADQRPLTSESRRAPRKSKTEALAALHSHAHSLSTDGEDPSQQDCAPIFPLLDAPIPVSSVFDLTTVKTSSPRLPPSRTAPRPFGLADCPVFYPTLDEFKDPMAYVRTISVTAKHYGICKVVPPPGWNMPFVTDTEVCRILKYGYFFLPRILYPDISFQNATSAAQFHRGIITSQGQFS